tara:strand:+ start:353 stop:1153 length:801 start_codon:yes stop_codon:yes gene_type:complete
MLGLGNSITSSIPLESEINHSLSFDGTNDFVDFTTAAFQAKLADSDANFKASGSVSIWVKLNLTSVNAQLWDFAIDTNNRIQLQYKHSGNEYNFTFKGGGTGKTAVVRPGVSHENDGSFHHIVCTWDKGDDNEMKIYVDGTLGATTPLASVALSGDFDSTADTTVGPDGTGGVEILSGTSFNGSADLNAFLDDFVLYSDVLTAEEADQLYNTGGSDPSLYQEYNNLIAHWTFNEGSGSTVTDEVSGFVGTLGTGATAPTFSTDNAG